MRAVFDAASTLEVFLPGPCPGCGLALPGDCRGLCGECVSRLVPVAGPRCPRCGGASDSPEASCLTCLSDPPYQAGTACWGEYEGVLRDAVLAMKHGRHDELARPLGRLLAARVSLEPWAVDLDLVTAVPSHPMHRLRRGFTAAELLAHEVGRALGLPQEKVLRRHGLQRQMGRSRAERLKLGRHRFSVRKARALTRRRLLLVDDVTTTGSTVSRAAQALLAGGAKEVYGAVLAWAPDTRRLA